MKRPRGMSFIEILIAVGIAGLAMMVFLSVFGTSGKHAVQTRNRTAATMLAHSLMDEIEAHPYGEPAPKAWGTGWVAPVTVWVNGRPQEMRFHQTLSFENSSFVDSKKTQVQDVVTVTLTWKEGVGDDQTSTAQDNKQLVVRVPVWK